MTSKGNKKPRTAAPRRKKTPSRTAARKPAATRPADNPAPAHSAHGVVTIRKYSNRRLYDTAASAHITQEDLYRMVGRGAMVRILDATTGEDITNQTLATALIEHDPGKLRLMPAWLLHQMIRLHEQAIGGWLSALWPPAATAGTAPLPGWPNAAGAWPQVANPIGLGAWAPWAVNSPAGPDAGTLQHEPPGIRPTRDETLDDLRREVASLLQRLSDLERTD